ncbi:MAG: hypothetical protein JWN82_385 [Candidatus Saccharibacteria bacterium]|nr:hypothetical protein [Candidatus Saccharibacteria bacterium]
MFGKRLPHKRNDGTPQPATPPVSRMEFEGDVIGYLASAGYKDISTDEGVNKAARLAAQYPKEIVWAGEITLARGMIKLTNPELDDEQLQIAAQESAILVLQSMGIELPPEEGWTPETKWPAGIFDSTPPNIL